MADQNNTNNGSATPSQSGGDSNTNGTQNQQAQNTAGNNTQTQQPAGNPAAQGAHTEQSTQANQANMFGQSILASPVAGYVVPAVLWVLILFSVISWAMLLIKGVQFGRFKSQSRRFLREFWKSRDLSEGAKTAQESSGALAHLARTGVDVVSGNDIADHRRGLAQQINRSDRLERSLRRQIQTERRSLENGLAVLASIGSTAPFIGLFGTVWGIMEALVRIGITGQADLGSVAGPIGHALIATGVGIAAAVPAVLIYNFFVRKLKLANGDMDTFAEEFYSLAQETSFSTKPVAAEKA